MLHSVVLPVYTALGPIVNSFAIAESLDAVAMQAFRP
jgi:hypothetical protein